MKYKTTYYKLNLNDEISISSNEYLYRIHKNKLNSDISDLEKSMSHLSSNLSINELEETRKIYSCNSRESKIISEIIRLRKIKENINNQRLTNEDTVGFNKHLNEIASEGWTLHSFNPIIKGYREFNKIDNYGIGHDVIEGFVLIWEKE